MDKTNYYKKIIFVVEEIAKIFDQDLEAISTQTEKEHKKTFRSVMFFDSSIHIVMAICNNPQSD